MLLEALEQNSEELSHDHWEIPAILVLLHQATRETATGLKEAFFRLLWSLRTRQHAVEMHNSRDTAATVLIFESCESYSLTKERKCTTSCMEIFSN